MSDFFNSIPVKAPKSTAFDLSHEVKLSCDFGQVVPFFMQEIISGDVFKVNVETLVRFAPLIAPIMHRVNVKIEFFYVPTRIIWDDFEDFIGGGEDGTANPPFPTLHITGAVKAGSLLDYMGIPVTTEQNFHPTSTPGNEILPLLDINALPFRAYWMIWNEYYRDQNLTDEVRFSTSSGTSSISANAGFFIVGKRAWEKDYFTSALPFPQRLPNPVSVPIVGEASVSFVPTADQQSFAYGVGSTTAGNPISYGDLAVGPFNKAGSFVRASIGTNSNSDTAANGSLRGKVAIDNSASLRVNLQDAASVNINELRKAFSLQRWLENSARSGARLKEILLSHFGVLVPDGRLQRPEFLGALKTPVVISEVMQTSATDQASTPQGTYAGTGTSYGRGFIFKKRFLEPGYVIGVMSVMPRSAYQQGIPKIFKKFDRFDYYWPEFAHLGEQEIKNYELFYDYGSSNEDFLANDETFGYTPRYAEYRFINSSVHGDFATNLNFWHMSRIFDSRPALNTEFVTVRAGRGSDSLNRIFAVEETNVNHLWCQLYVNCRALRPLPKYGKPGL